MSSASIKFNYLSISCITLKSEFIYAKKIILCLHLTFAYNGGPGSSSLWLHLGVLGPRHVAVNDTEITPPPPYKIEDNLNTIFGT